MKRLLVRVGMLSVFYAVVAGASMAVWPAPAALMADEPAAAVKIKGDPKVAPYSLVRNSVTGVQPADGILWKVLPADGQAVDVQFSKAGTRGHDIEWVAPPGSYRVSVTAVRKDAAAGFVFNEDSLTVTIGPGAPAPKPKPKPKPVDPVEPVNPVVPDDAPDAALVAKFKPLIAAADKADADKLGKVYSTTGALLASVKDPAVKPKKFADVVAILKGAVTGSMIPPLPALSDLRVAIDKELGGGMDAMTPLTDAIIADLSKQYKRVGAAVSAAAK